MWSMWNAPSDMDYYGQSGFSGDEPEEDEEIELEPPEYVLEEREIGPEPPAEEQGEQQMAKGILRFDTNAPVEEPSAGTTGNVSKDAMANRSCIRSKAIG